MFFEARLEVAEFGFEIDTHAEDAADDHQNARYL